MTPATGPPRSIKIAVLAMGGEGGGVLADWIVDLAEHGGYLAQSTSVPGVAQRTGATIYYVELFSRAAAEAAGKEPVLALIPTPGDVDIVIASELMEAGRAVQRGFVTPDRTMLITSTHRVYAITEKIALGDGRVSDAALLEACEKTASRLIAFDMEAIAGATRSAISAVLFGALAGTQALPFARPAFEAAIRRSGLGGNASLAAFAAGFEAASGGPRTATPESVSPEKGETPAAGADTIGDQFSAAVEAFPAVAQPIVRAGIARLIDYQDAAYAWQYLSRLQRFGDLEQTRGDGSSRLFDEAARELVLRMAYEDTVRVAELKIRSARFVRVHAEARVLDDQILEIAEYFHPRVQEIADTLPLRWGRWLLKTPWARRLVERLTRSGRVIKSTSASGFLLLYAVVGLKPWRRISLRFAGEQADIDRWLNAVFQTALRDYALAVELAETSSLMRGYGETRERGRARFETLMQALPAVSALPDPAAALRSLRKAAEADESGTELARALCKLSIGVATNPDAR
ncbi:MAG: indolepyruvate oxidoreductase subunit beta family protein [Rhodoplanes sp.]